MKRKLTLSIDDDVIKKAKSILALKNTTLSTFVENNLKTLYFEEELDNAFESIGIKYNYISPDKIVKERKKMKVIDTKNIIDKIRDQRHSRNTDIMN